MKPSSLLRPFLAVLLLLAPAVASVARAEMVLAESSLFVNASVTEVVTVDATGPGIVEIVLSDLQWYAPLSSLTLAISDASGVLRSFSGSGSHTYALGGAARLYAHITGIGSGSLRFGLLGYRVVFHPSTPTVPLPAAAWLLLGGLGGLGALGRLRRRAREIAN